MTDQGKFVESILKGFALSVIGIIPGSIVETGAENFPHTILEPPLYTSLVGILRQNIFFAHPV
jgi:hypothetical protein